MTSPSAAPAEPALVYHALSGIEPRALTGFMHRAFVGVHDEPYGLGGLPKTPADAHLIDPESLSATKIFRFQGHGLPRNMFLRSVYPEFFANSRFLLFAFVAEPLRSAAHGYAWLAAQPGGGPSIAFAEFLRRRQPNLYAGSLSCRWWNWRGALRPYFFVGVAERPAESVAALAGKIDESYGVLPQTANIARARYFMRRYFDDPEADEGSAAIDALIGALDAGTESAFRRRNRLDFRIYEDACRRLDEDARTHAAPRLAEAVNP